MRKGETAQLSAIERKSMSMGSNADGGYLVPPETEAQIEAVLKLVSPIRAIAGVRQVSSSLYKKPFAITGAATGWVGETAARPETAAPTLAELQFPTMELYAMPAATQSLLDDAAVNLDQWLADEVQPVFAEQEGQAFVTGNGTNKPKGFLAYTKVADASWSWGNLGYIATRNGGRLSGFQSRRQADRSRLCAEKRLPPERPVDDEPQDPERDPQVQGRAGELSLAAGAIGGGKRHPAGLPGDRSRAHARYRHRQLMRWPSAISRGAI